jgi:HlyD family secretion protein
MVIKRKASNLRWIWLAAAIAVGLVFYFVHLATRTRVPIRVASVVRSGLKSTISTNGRVEPQLNYEAHAPFPGIVTQLYVHEGDKTPAGKLLLAMDDTDAKARVAAALAALRGAQAAYDSMLKGGTQEERLTLGGDMTTAQANRDQAQRDVAALQKLQLTGAASANEVAAAQQRLASANGSLKLLQAKQTQRYDQGDVARAKSAFDEAQAGYAAASAILNESRVRAPFAGTVYSLPVSRTEYVSPGGMLLQMADLTKMQVRGYLDEPDIGKLEVGQAITIQWDARPNETWHGHVARVPSTIINYGTRNVGEVLVSLDDADGNLLPATNVRITVTVANKENALNIPREALHTEPGQAYVYRVENGVLRRVAVTIGNLNTTQVEIRSGLNEGDMVALGSTNGQPIGNRVPVVPVQ